MDEDNCEHPHGYTSRLAQPDGDDEVYYVCPDCGFDEEVTENPMKPDKDAVNDLRWETRDPPVDWSTMAK